MFLNNYVSIYHLLNFCENSIAYVYLLWNILITKPFGRFLIRKNVDEKTVLYVYKLNYFYEIHIPTYNYIPLNVSYADEYLCY